MVSKKKRFGDDEIAIFDDGCIYKRGDYWHFRLWLKAENKYARKSLGTTNRATALERHRVEAIGAGKDDAPAVGIAPADQARAGFIGPQIAHAARR